MKNRASIRIKPETRIKPQNLPESFIDTLSEAFKREEDICTVLSVYSYLFCSMKIDEIRDRIIVPDDGGPRVVSREYVRRRIELFMNKLQPLHFEMHGECSIAPNFPDRNMHPVDRSVKIDHIASKMDMEDDNIINEQTKDSKTKDSQQKEPAVLTEEEISEIESEI